MIAGIGAVLPDKVVSNADLTKIMNTTERFIEERTGILTRRHVQGTTSASDLGRIAAERALAHAGIDRSEVGLILFNTITPDCHDPGTVCFLQDKLGMNGCAAIDLRGQCAGFIYGLVIAQQFVRSQACKHVLVVGSEVLSKRLDTSDDGRNLAILLGDGAGAAVVSATAPPRFAIVAHTLGADGEQARALWTEAPGSALAGGYMTSAAMAQGRHHFRMNGGMVFAHAVDAMATVAKDLLEKTGLSLADIDWCLPHQANLRIIEAVAARLGLPMAKVLTNVQAVGNTASASVPILLDQALNEGKLRPGQRVLAISFGGGFIWGGVLLEVMQ